MDFVTHIPMLAALVLVIARLAGMLVMAPVFGEAVVPLRLRWLIAAVMALGVAPRVTAPAALPAGDLALALAVAGEVLIGLAIGYAARLVFVGVELGAFHISQQMGLSLGEIIDPLTEEPSDTLRRFFHLLAVVIFLAIGGHRMLIAAMIASFQAVPLMSFFSPQAMLTALAALLAASFTLALKVAAPVLLAMLLASLAMGLVQRTLPQFNFLSTGAPARVLIGLAVIAVVLGLGVMVDLMGSANSILGAQLRAMLETRP